MRSAAKPNVAESTEKPTCGIRLPAYNLTTIHFNTSSMPYDLTDMSEDTFNDWSLKIGNLLQETV